MKAWCAAAVALAACQFEEAPPARVACAEDGRCPEETRCVAGMCQAEPEVRIAAPLAEQVFLPGAVVALRGEAIEFDGTATPDARLAWNSDVAGALGTGAALDVALAGGRHAITLQAIDGKGRVGRATVAARVDRAPVVTIEAPVEGQRYFRGRDVVQLRGSAVDPEDGQVPPERLYWSVDGVRVMTGAAGVADVAGGEHAISLVAVDADGGTGQRTASVRLESVRQLGADTIPIYGLAISSEFVLAGSYGSGLRLWYQSTGVLAQSFAAGSHLRSNAVAAVSALLVRPVGGGLGYAYAAGTPLGISVVGDMTTEWTLASGLIADAVTDLWAGSYCGTTCLSGPIRIQVVAAGPAGVSRYWTNAWQTFPAGQNGLTARPMAVAVDDSADSPGILYAGGAGGAALWLGSGAWQPLTTALGAPLADVRDIAMRPLDTQLHPEVWLATAAGPVRSSGGVTKVFGPNDGAPPTARAIATSPEAVWVAADGGGVWRFIGATATWTEVTGLPSNDALSLVVDNAGAGWLGLRDGRILVVAP